MSHPGDLVVIEKPLSQKEEKRLAELETVIDENIKGFYAVWFALKEISDKRLYRTEENRTFVDYCNEVWDLSKSRAYQYIEAAEVIENVRHGARAGEIEMSPIGDILDGDNEMSTMVDILPFPTNERQARALAKIPAEHQATVWKLACDDAKDDGVKLSAKLISKAVKDFKIQQFGKAVKDLQRTAIPPREPKTTTPNISEPLRTCFANMLEIIQHEASKGWRGSNQDVVVTWLRTLLTAAEEGR